MGWLSKILKGSSSSSSSFKSNKKSRCTCRDPGESSTVDDDVDSSEEGSAEDSEPDDADCSTTTSLSEASEKELDEEDERLALAHRRNSSLDSRPQFDTTTIFQTYPTFYSAYSSRSCATCYEEIYGEYFHRCANSFWLTPEYGTHQDQIINPTPFADNYENYSWYHPSEETYYNVHPHLTCDVCQELVPVDSSGSPQCIKTPIWGQIYCHHHERDGTASCFTCRRRQPFGTKYSELSDGRRICSDCKKSAIASVHECRPLIDDMQRFYEGLDMKVDLQFPFILVDQKELNKNGPGNAVGLTRAIEVPLRTIFKFPLYGADNKLIKMVTEPHKLVSYKEVVHIQLLNNTPRLYMGKTLAHEMMHAWLRLNGSYLEVRGYKEFGYMGNESDKVHEGICNVMGYMWLESELQAISRRSKHISSSRLNFERKLAQHLKLQMEGNRDPTYGDGFRLMHQAVRKYGLKGTLDYLRMTGMIPA